MLDNLFQWDQDLNTGLDDVDQQHKNLVNIINETLQLSFEQEKIALKTIARIHDKLGAYVTVHFDTEEALMLAYGIDDRHVKDHKNTHEAFKNKLEDYFSDYGALVDPKRLSNISEYLIRWLAYHILNTDKSLAEQISLIERDKLTPKEAYETEFSTNQSASEPLLKALKALFILVSEKNQELRLNNQELENRVAERTQELTKAYDQLEKISLLDELTGLPNRRYAMIELEKLIGKWERYGTTFSILFIDVDKFKAVNDNFGHKAGDQVLMDIASFFKSHLRTSDTACRIGGDEFLVICSHCDYKSAEATALKLKDACQEEALQALKTYWQPSFSIGIAEISEDCASVSCILNQADEAMYQEKHKGGGQWESFF